MEKQTKYCITKKALMTGLRSSYDAINHEAFNGELPNIPIIVERLHTVDGDAPDAAFTVKRRTNAFWTESGRHSYGVEYISISVDSSATCFDDTDTLVVILVDIMFHEMIHEYCYLQGIKDNNYDTQYHNFQFMAAVEEHGGICHKLDVNHGFMLTSVSDDLYSRVIARIPEEVWELMRRGIKARYV